MVLCAIGDSFTYIDNHLEESDYRISKGYVHRLVDKLPCSCEIKNVSINGGRTIDFLSLDFPKADIYTILLGTNDWHYPSYPLGSKDDFINANPISTLGNLGFIIGKIKEISKEAKIYLANPTERGRFVYIFGYDNNALGSDFPNDNGVMLSEYADAIKECASIYPDVCLVNLHDETGFKPDNMMNFFLIKEKGELKKLDYKEYRDYPISKSLEVYPYPIESVALGSDGLHPSDKGYEIIASIFARVILDTYKFKK